MTEERISVVESFGLPFKNNKTREIEEGFVVFDNICNAFFTAISVFSAKEDSPKLKIEHLSSSVISSIFSSSLKLLDSKEESDNAIFE